MFLVYMVPYGAAVESQIPIWTKVNGVRDVNSFEKISLPLNEITEFRAVSLFKIYSVKLSKLAKNFKKNPFLKTLKKNQNNFNTAPKIIF